MRLPPGSSPVAVISPNMSAVAKAGTGKSGTGFEKPVDPVKGAGTTSENNNQAGLLLGGTSVVASVSDLSSLQADAVVTNGQQRGISAIIEAVNKSSGPAVQTELIFPDRKRRLIGDEFYKNGCLDEDEDEVRVKAEDLITVTTHNGSVLVVETDKLDTLPTVLTDAVSLETTTAKAQTTTTTTAVAVTGATTAILPDHKKGAVNGHCTPKPLHHDYIVTDALDMATLAGMAVKNEPEDLTGPRRNSSDTLSMTTSHLKEKPTSVVVSTPDGHVVLSSAELSGYSPPVTSSPDLPYAPPTGADFAFDATTRAIYQTVGESYRTSEPGQDLYNPSGSPDFASPVPRVTSDVQYVQYTSHYKGPPSNGGPNAIPSPDSGIGEPHIGTPSAGTDSSFDYPHTDILNDINRKPWHDYGRQNEEKVHIPKIFSPYGFKYTLETPTSSSVRREDDRITYVNKGQFYGITLEYTPDPDMPPLKATTVKSVIMLVFREGKSLDEEVKAWQFWHARQHSVKQRILDADTKNSMGLVGCIEEVAHNALAVYWNPLESPAKVSIAVQCLSTDFSTQKGVKGLPLHVQIDTYEDPRENAVYHRGYCQIKVFCDKGAERKARDEERRAQKRRMTTTGKRRLDEMYHQGNERSEFYSMSDLSKPPVMFTPSDDPEKAALEFGTELPSFYSRSGSPPPATETLLKLNGSCASGNGSPEPVRPPPPAVPLSPPPGAAAVTQLSQLPRQLLQDIRPAASHSPYDALLHMPPEKRLKMVPPITERIMIYVRQETEDAYTALHLVPPTVPGLIRAIESKYKINASNIRFLYRKSKQGVLAKIDDDMLRFYCNEDVFLMQVMVTEGAGGDDSMVYDITLTEC